MNRRVIAVPLTAPLLPLLSLSSAFLSAQSPTIYEPGWTLRATVSLAAPISPHVSPQDRSVFVASKGGSGSLHRIDQNLTVTTICPSNDAHGVVVDGDGDVFFSRGTAGVIERVAAGQTSSQTWVSGFHSGDDDPTGMAIAPPDYVGPVLLPGDALVTDAGWNGGPQEIWKWDPANPEGEVRVLNDNGQVAEPRDVAIGRRAIYFVDWAVGTAPGRLRQLIGVNQERLVWTPIPLPAVGGVAIDPLDQQVLLRARDHVLRLDPSTGATSLVVSWTASSNPYAPCGVDVSADGTLMVVSDAGANLVFLFERRGPRYTAFASGCPGSLPTTHLTMLQEPRLGGTLRVGLDNLPLGRALLFTGVSRTSSTFGPLPLPLGIVGMPGCLLHVSPDLASPVLGAGSQAVFALPIPLLTNLVGLRFYQQALVPDPAANGAGAVVSDAAEALVDL